jgi:uncharacterized protein (DUF1810 family)
VSVGLSEICGVKIRRTPRRLKNRPQSNRKKSPVSETKISSDPFHLDRFVRAQERTYATALDELRRGSKESHWMWFVFPQLAGLGHSAMAREYAIKNLDEAHAYLAHPLLGPRLLECCRALLAVTGKSASEIMGYPDDMKLRSSMMLFSLATTTQPEFNAVLKKFFTGEPDALTFELLGGRRPALRNGVRAACDHDSVRAQNLIAIVFPAFVLQVSRSAGVRFGCVEKNLFQAFGGTAIRWPINSNR